MNFQAQTIEEMSENEEKIEDELPTINNRVKDKYLKCDVCGKQYENASNLKNHLRSHFDKNYYIYCHICAKTVSPWKLKIHLKNHSKDPNEVEIKTEMEYTCRYCGLKFDKANNRTSHEKRIHKSKENGGFDNFKCKECNLVFLTQEELRTHGFEHFNGKIHVCDFPGCNRQFKKGKLLTVHKKCHFEPQVKCLDCGQMFVQRAGLLKHQKFGRCPVMKVKQQELPVEVTESNAKVAQNQFIALKGRLNTKSESNNEMNFILDEFDFFSDDANEETFGESQTTMEAEQEDWNYEYLDEDLIEADQIKNESNPLEIIEEVNYDDFEIFDVENFKTEASEKSPSKTPEKKAKVPKNNSENKYECDFCGKEFTSRTSIVSHLLVTHKEIADYDCDQCFKKFKSSGNLTRHKKTVHSDNMREWNCDKCGALFKEKYQLDLHLHNHDQPSKCEICGKMVTNLKVHMRHHATKKNNVTVECPLCGKKTGKYQLMRHIKSVHEKAFQKASTSSLKIYPCSDCGEYFSRRQELRQHEYVSHTQDKIYECKICGNVFKKLKLLNVHRFSHQPLNVKCNFCDNVYARKAALYKHMKKHHPESYVNPRAKSSEWNVVEYNTEL